jgi:uncharacterized oxidoreductase
LVDSNAGLVVPFRPRIAGDPSSRPGAREIHVERVKCLRCGEARGDYDQVVTTLNAADPHGN